MSVRRVEHGAYRLWGGYGIRSPVLNTTDRAAESDLQGPGGMGQSPSFDLPTNQGLDLEFGEIYNLEDGCGVSLEEVGLTQQEFLDLQKIVFGSASSQHPTS